MENKRKELHYLSIGMFTLIALQIVSLLQYLLDMNNIVTTDMDAAMQAALPIINVLTIASAVIGIIILAFLGVKGIKEAKQPTSARFHINLAFVSSIFFGLGTIALIPDLFQSTDLFRDIGPVLISGLFFFDTLSYALTAKAIRVMK